MTIRIDIPSFRCPEGLEVHLKKLFAGEYEVPLWGHSKRILDIGANVGAFSVWASYRWPFSHVFAYEPNPACFTLFKANTARMPGITFHEWGVGREGMRPLYNGLNNLGEATLFMNAVTDGTGRHVEIKDPLTLPDADILKMDVEGAEYEILAPLIRDKRTFEAIMFEWHNEELRNACDSLLKDYVLVKCNIYTPSIGVSCYINRRLM